MERSILITMLQYLFGLMEGVNSVFSQVNPASIVMSYDKVFHRPCLLLLLLFIDHTQNGTQYINIYNTHRI